MSQKLQQDSAVAFAGQLVATAQAFRDLRSQVAALVAVNTSNNYDALFKVLPTFAWAADGTAGQADATPNNAHPISAQSLNRSENQLLGLLYLLADFQAFLAGGALAATASRSVTIDQLVG
jgi:hypothetical protein